LFLAENTEERPDLEYWQFRSVREYQKLLSFAGLEHKGDYYDLDERISILAGRKRELK
jgi:hypothetical protein